MRLLFLALALAGAAPAAAQPAGGAADPALAAEIATIRRLIAQVEQQRWVLIPSQGSVIAISPEQAGELFVHALFEGRIHPDSIEIRAHRLRTDSNRNLILLKQELARMEQQPAPRWPAGRGPEGAWVVHCSGDYPSTMQGRIATEVNSDGRFSLTMYRRAAGPEFAWIAMTERLQASNTASGEARFEWGCNQRGVCRGTMRWTAQVTLIRPSSGPNTIDGVIHGQGTLALVDDDSGSCTGTWSAP